jgi:hypothetical protein
MPDRAAVQGPLILACGALASELRAVLRHLPGEPVQVMYLPANLHNRPEQIVPALRKLLAQHDPQHQRHVLFAYGDCGTGGQLDNLLAEHPGARRLPGDHCYEFFASTEMFREISEAELGTLYLTDFLAKHFDALLWQGLGLDRHPELRDMYFAAYRRVLLLTQRNDASTVEAGRRAAAQLGLDFEHRHVGLEPFAHAVSVGLRKVA